MLRITVRFPLGVYHAQSAADFATAEWPPHPVRLVAALTAAAHAGPVAALDGAREAVARLAEADPPQIAAPRAGDPESADGVMQLARLRGASRWAPRNHELAELRGGKGISPRDLGRGRAEVQKVGVAVGGVPVSFEWPDLILDEDAVGVLRALAENVTVLGTARSPVVMTIDTTGPAAEATAVWAPTDDDGGHAATRVRVPSARTPTELDAWHARRSAPLRRDGHVPPAPYVPPVAMGDDVAYIHGIDAATSRPEPLDPKWWGDMLIVAVDRDRSQDLPKAAVTFALARSMRKALLDTYGAEGTREEAPPVLRGRGGHPHAAFVPLSFVVDTEPSATPRGGARFAGGQTLGVAIILPHPDRLGRVARQRLEVEAGLSRLLGLIAADATPVRVPGVGNVWLKLPTTTPALETLREPRYRRASRRWSTVTPLVHSRYLPRKSDEALFEQVARECSDVGIPAPVKVVVRRVPRFRGAPVSIDSRGVPQSWTGPLGGPQVHLDLWFEDEIRGPVLLGRARHFGLGLCLPFDDETSGSGR